MKYFDKIPKNYQDGLNEAVAEFWGDEEKIISDLFRDCEAEVLLDCDIHSNDEISRADIEGWIDKLCWFAEGWKARENYKTQPVLL